MRYTTEAQNLVSDLRNWYWHIRALRKHDQAKRRTLYRRIRASKLRLIELGADPLELHHFCLSLTTRGIYDSTRHDRWQQQIARLHAAGRIAITFPEK